MSDFITELRDAGSPGFGTSAFMSTALSSGFYATTTYGTALDPRSRRILRCQRMYSWSFQASASCVSSSTRLSAERGVAASMSRGCTNQATVAAGPLGDSENRYMAHLMDQATAWKVCRDLGGDNGVATPS